MKTINKHSKHRPAGASSVEYALLLVMVAIVLVGVMASVEGSVGDFWSNAASVLMAPGGFG
ncbi:MULTISPECIES: Flp family type IVb pilin [Ralstonia]|jgi:pilus assembly protein Flp/PilA|uniref:Flp family type IVb pilin n=1 Tax=Ralstonia flaminis TaxID=3058597 RepID=A0ABM9JYY5_9RALS|nr:MULTISPECIES: Flp family type IVb pilin [unclassified Ralstonia]CAJ0808931.1 hypothetical protein LMG18101_00468 [Ralstonia sp. LMG 18101]